MKPSTLYKIAGAVVLFSLCVSTWNALTGIDGCDPPEEEPYEETVTLCFDLQMNLVAEEYVTHFNLYRAD